MKKPDRLFVPLAKEPYLWFKSGKKRWELRKNQGQFTDKYVWPGRRVELRLGYRNPERALWGTVLNVVPANSIEEFFEKVSYKDVIPNAENATDAITIAQTILRLKPKQPRSILGFEIELR